MSAPASPSSTPSPWWARLLLLAALAAFAIGLPLLLRARRRGAWQTDLAAAVGEVRWVARELVPDLRRTASAQGAAGGWAVSGARVIALEDRLTGLATMAPDEVSRESAERLRDAVREAHGRLDQLAGLENGTDTLLLLDEVGAGLEAQLRPFEQATRDTT